MELGDVGAQLVHASRRSSTGDHPEDTHAVVLQVPGEPELLEVSEQLTAAGVAHVLVREPDPPFLGSATAIGVPPQDRDRVRPLLRKLRLLK